MGEQRDIVIFEKDSTLAELIREYLLETSGELNISVFDSIQEGLLFCARGNIDVIVFDCDMTENASNAVEKIFAVKPNSKIITLAYRYDTQSVFQLMRWGVVDCVTKPVITETFIKAYQNAVAPRSSENREAKTISVFSNKGGLGKTSVAVNLAISLSEFSIW